MNNDSNNVRDNSGIIPDIGNKYSRLQITKLVSEEDHDIFTRQRSERSEVISCILNFDIG